MLPDGDAVREAVLDALPGLKPGAVVIDMSSSDPAALAPWAMLKPTISRWSMPRCRARFKAKDGTLAIMAGGDRKAFRQGAARPEEARNQIFHVGPLGAGHAVKALNNYLGAAGHARGIRGAADRAALRPGSGADDRCDQCLDRAQQHHGAQDPAGHPDRRFASGFKLALMTKDVGIAAELRAKPSSVPGSEARRS